MKRKPRRIPMSAPAPLDHARIERIAATLRGLATVEAPVRASRRTPRPQTTLDRFIREYRR